MPSKRPPAPPQMILRPDQIIVLGCGSLKIIRALDVGGMGAVYEAVRADQPRGRKLAVKVILGEYRHNPDMVARFKLEAAVLSGMTHPHILVVDGVWETQNLAEPLLVLVMELLNGVPLRRLVGKQISLFHVYEIALEALRALRTIHELGIIHRDIKLENFFLHNPGDGKRIVKLIDFGIVREIRRAELDESERGMFIGTTGFASPEQMQGLPVSFDADLYAFSCTLYELLTGKPVFSDIDPNDAESVRRAHLSREPRDICTLVPTLPAPVGQMIMRALAKDPAKRPSSAEEYAVPFDDARYVEMHKVGPKTLKGLEKGIPDDPDRQHDGQDDQSRGKTLRMPHAVDPNLPHTTAPSGPPSEIARMPGARQYTAPPLAVLGEAAFDTGARQRAAVTAPAAPVAEWVPAFEESRQYTPATPEWPQQLAPSAEVSPPRGARKSTTSSPSSRPIRVEQRSGDELTEPSNAHHVPKWAVYALVFGVIGILLGSSYLVFSPDVRAPVAAAPTRPVEPVVTTATAVVVAPVPLPAPIPPPTVEPERAIPTPGETSGAAHADAKPVQPQMANANVQTVSVPVAKRPSPVTHAPKPPASRTPTSQDMDLFALPTELSTATSRKAAPPKAPAKDPGPGF